MKAEIRALFWSKKKGKNYPILKLILENQDDQKVCKEIIDKGFSYGSSWQGTTKDPQLISVEVIIGSYDKE